MKRKLRIKNSIKEIRKRKRKISKPQFKGVTVKVFTMTPKKPNSAIRKVAKVRIRLANKKKRIIIAYIPGENHTLSINNQVLVVAGRTQDLPGLKYKIVRGALDCK